MHEWRYNVFNAKSVSESGRSSAQGGNGNVRDSRAENKHTAIVTPHMDAVRNLKTGTGYQGRHRAE